jgi:cytochrome c oxidase subunit 2
VISLMMPYWHFRGKQNSRGEAYAVHSAAFMREPRRSSPPTRSANATACPMVEPAPGGDAYLTARMWAWYPILKLRQGETYRVHLSSLDLNTASRSSR